MQTTLMPPLTVQEIQSLPDFSLIHHNPDTTCPYMLHRTYGYIHDGDEIYTLNDKSIPIVDIHSGNAMHYWLENPYIHPNLYLLYNPEEDMPKYKCICDFHTVVLRSGCICEAKLKRR